MTFNDVEITPCVISFTYPWFGKSQDVPGFKITRVIPNDAPAYPITLLDENTPKPQFPVVACISVLVNRIDDFRFMETTTHIPLI